MPLDMRPNVGKFYGRLQVNNKRVFIDLELPIKGRRPQSLREEGDPPFERSRAVAQAKLDEIEKQIRERGNEVLLTEKLLFLKQGVSFERVALSGMFDAWVALSPGKVRSARYLAQIKSLCEKFAQFAANRKSPALEMAQVSSALAADFVRSIENTGVTEKTRNEQANRLKTVFKDLADKSGVSRNPFGQIKKLKVVTAHRQPLTIEQIATLLDAVKRHPFARVLIVTALSTAMRRCDCCLLQFRRIKWAERVIAVKPAKDGSWVYIPIFGLLEAELAPLYAGKVPAPNDYVFAEQAQMFLVNPDGVTLRVKQALESAGFAWNDDEPDSHEKAMSVKRARGVRRASLIGFHSLRTTWITLAIMGGVPVELVKKVTGQHSTEVILTHYFRPLQSQVRDALKAKMHPLLTGNTCPIEVDVKPVSASGTRIRELIVTMTDSNWRQVREEVLSLLDS